MGKMHIINLNKYSAIVINISGGKDSQTILGEVVKLAKSQDYGGQIMAVHADTGAGWRQSLPHCEMMCDHFNIPFQVAKPFRALPDHIERRCKIQACKGVPGWPDMQNRYCTSDCKRAPIQKVIRAEFPAKGIKDQRHILNITGERRLESPGRAKLKYLAPDKQLTTKKRVVTKWHPILDYTLDDVWQHIASTGLKRHVAYDLGNKRLSCAICMLATDADIRRGAEARPDLAYHFLNLENECGFSMKHKKSLAEILSQTGGN